MEGSLPTPVLCVDVRAALKKLNGQGGAVCLRCKDEQRIAVAVVSVYLDYTLIQCRYHSIGVAP
jgi:hypothetical protein